VSWTVSSRRALVQLVLASGTYGFCIGAVHSWRFALANVVKFPVLILVTTALCAASYFLVARLLAPELRLGSVCQLVLAIYRDAAVLLASLATVCLFIALTMEQPRSLAELADYPAFLAMNVAFVALCGSLAVWRAARAFLRQHQIAARRSAAIVGAWLALSLAVGGQWAWYLRPFVGVRAYQDVDLVHGTRPDYRGATSFYEAVGHVIVPPGRLGRR